MPSSDPSTSTSTSNNTDKDKDTQTHTPLNIRRVISECALCCATSVGCHSCACHRHTKPRPHLQRDNGVYLTGWFRTSTAMAIQTQVPPDHGQVSNREPDAPCRQMSRIALPSARTPAQLSTLQSPQPTAFIPTPKVAHFQGDVSRPREMLIRKGCLMVNSTSLHIGNEEYSI